MANINLLLLDTSPEKAPSSETVFGGLPSADHPFSWPVCRSCGGNMQFLGQIRHPDAQRLHLIFMCQNNPGVCEEWEADGGANAVICSGIDNLKIHEAPSEGEVVRPGLPYGAKIEQVQSSGYDEARGEWAQAHPERQREVLGQTGGEAAWLQADETPGCSHCGKPMRFVAQLEEGPDYNTAMNFGAGCGYLFECECEEGTGKFLWQC